MPDRKQVIWDIERCICHVPDACRDCSKYEVDGANCMETLMADALALLREQDTVDHALDVLRAHGWKDEQEPVKPNTSCDGLPGEGGTWWYVCGNCSNDIDPDDAYCRHCGRAVKWNDAE